MAKKFYAVLCMLLAGAVGALQPASGAAAADTSSFDTKALVHQTQRQLNDAGQFYLVWWIPPVLLQTLLHDNSGAPQAEAEQMVRALDSFIVFAVARGQEGAAQLEDLRDRADLLGHSHLSVDGQPLPDPALQIDAAAAPALAAVRPTLEAMLGRNGHGIEFALYRYPPGMHALDPSMSGKMEYSLYRKRFVWQLPVWDPLVGAAPSAVPMRATPIPVPAAAMTAPPAPVASAQLAAPMAGTTPSAPAAIPVQRRKIDPTSGEEFPERYNYNPYTGQKLVSQ
jgi:hypothetical protein